MTALYDPHDEWDAEYGNQEVQWTADMSGALFALLDKMISDDEAHRELITQLSAKVHEFTYRIADLDRRIKELEGEGS
jgi:hypothetical protein